MKDELTKSTDGMDGKVYMKDIKLTLEQADRVREVWGIFLEFTNGTLLVFFLGAIPESFLPYPKSVIKQALDITEKHFKSQGHSEAVEAISQSRSYLSFYVSDEEAFSNMMKDINNESRLIATKNKMGKHQEECLEYLLKNY